MLVLYRHCRSSFLFRIKRLKTSKDFRTSVSKLSQGRIFSGIQPTGIPHLGNYFGAIKRWKELQDGGYECIYSIVDLHAITVSHDPEILRKNIEVMTACLLACGINPEKSILFQQSAILQHTQLAWILGCLVTMPRLSRLPQYKEKTEKLKDIPLGLFIYPVLQAADILLYKTNLVPVGEDQIHHIQLAQRIAEIFNNKFKKIFIYPKPLIDLKSARVKSLRSPHKKMSKSESNPLGRIELMDSPEVIREKMKKAVTDFTSAVTFDPELRPGVSNIIMLHSLFTRLTTDEICEQNKGLETAEYKLLVADIIIESLRPTQQRIQELLSEKLYLKDILQLGTTKARNIALQTLEEVSQVIGLHGPNSNENTSEFILKQ